MRQYDWLLFFKLLGDPNRLQILKFLSPDQRIGSEIAEATGLPPSNVSFHMRALRKAGPIRKVCHCTLTASRLF